jgi:fructokinase
MTAYGGIETGGSKWACAVGTGPDDVRATATFPTGSPAETIAQAVDFFQDGNEVAAVGIGSFGPVDVRAGSATWGHVTTTPKPGWANIDLAGAIGRALGVPVAFDTDVNAAALGEHRWGAAQGIDTFVYITVGTGIGGGGMAGGRLLHGLVHPEFGHMRIPRDPDDAFAGACPYHGDCWEGLASGRAIEERWGAPGHTLDADRVWELEARYLALGVVSVIAVLSPAVVVLGGGVMQRDGLLERVRADVDGLLAGYVDAPAIVHPALGPRSGMVGALALAEELVAQEPAER